MLGRNRPAAPHSRDPSKPRFVATHGRSSSASARRIWFALIPAVGAMFPGRAPVSRTLGTWFRGDATDFQGFQMIMNFLVMPMFFLSGAMFRAQQRWPRGIGLRRAALDRSLLPGRRCVRGFAERGPAISASRSISACWGAIHVRTATSRQAAAFFADRKLSYFAVAASESIGTSQ